jgi:hypothetical protein
MQAAEKSNKKLYLLKALTACNENDENERRGELDDDSESESASVADSQISKTSEDSKVNQSNHLQLLNKPLNLNKLI